MPASRHEIRVVPRAGRCAVEVRPDGTLVVRVTEPAEGGRANAAAVELLADHFGVPKRCVTILRGSASRTKLIEIASP